MKGSIVDNVKLIQAMIDEEDRNWIPSKGVEDFHFEWSQLRDLNWRFVAEDTNDYLYLNRDDWFEVTIQRWHFKDLTYYFVYVEKEVDDKGIWIPQELVSWTQSICHTFRWVRSLRHALKLWELWSELALGIFHPEDYFLTKDERDNGKLDN
jgi:hypothetical protein